MKKVWLAGRYTSPKPWEVLGIFNTEEKAVIRCTRENDFVAPFHLNELLSENRKPMPNMYYPINNTQETA